MKHPIRDRFLILLCAACALCVTAGAVALVIGRITVEPAIMVLGRVANMSLKTKGVLIVIAVVFALFALLLIGIVLPAKKKRSSNFAYQQNENGMVRISLKALEALVHRCLNQHSELKVVSSSLFSDEESVRVDVHITLQSDISMPLAVSALQKQIKRYLEACTGVQVEEVRVFVDGTLNANKSGEKSPYAIPATMLGGELPTIEEEQEEGEAVIEAPEKAEESSPAAEEAPVQASAAEETAAEAPRQEASIEEASIKEASIEEASIEEAPVEEAPVNENEGE